MAAISAARARQYAGAMIVVVPSTDRTCSRWAIAASAVLPVYAHAAAFLGLTTSRGGCPAGNVFLALRFIFSLLLTQPVNSLWGTGHFVSHDHPGRRVFGGSIHLASVWSGLRDTTRVATSSMLAAERFRSIFSA